MTNLTAKEAQVLTAICSAEEAQYAIDDLGSTWTDAKEIAQATGLSLRSVAGVLGNLAKKGLIYADEEGGERGELTLQCISEAGCELLMAGIEAGAAEAEADEAAEPVAAKDSNFAIAFQQNGGHLPRQLCKALRAVAASWEGSRKEFLDEAEAAGLNRSNAAAEWQAGRKA